MSAPDTARGRHVQIEANGLSIGCSIRGAGAPLVLIHGAEAGHEMFAALVSELAARYTVIAYDQRDTGSTRDLTDEGRAYSLADLADDVAGLIEALGYVKAHVFGTSLGGHIAQLFAVRHPDRIDRLILSSTFLAGASLLSVNANVAQELAGWRSGGARYAPEIATKFFPVTVLRDRPELVELFRGGRRDAAQSARRNRLLGDPYPIGDGEIRARTLLLMGAEDALIPNAATRAVARILHEPEIRVLPGIGHVAAIQAPAKLAEVMVAFLEA
jgi:pimeloyl-ACP methyl ester carboxylesterase